MRQVIVVALWVLIAVAHGKDIVRGESDDLEQRLRDLTEFEDPLVVDRGQCSATYHKVGCYLDNGAGKALPELLFQDRSEHSPKYGGQLIGWKQWDTYMPNLVCRCASAAKAKGYTYYAIQYYGECWSGPTSTNPHSLSQASSSCTTVQYQECNKDDANPCVGKEFNNFLYHLNGGDHSGGGQIGYAYDF